MSDDTYWLTAHVNQPARSPNGQPNRSETKAILFKTSEKVAEAIVELWDETDWFMVGCRDKFVASFNNPKWDLEAYYSKENASQGVKRLLDDGAAAVIAGGGKSGEHTAFLHYVK